MKKNLSCPRARSLSSPRNVCQIHRRSECNRLRRESTPQRELGPTQHTVQRARFGNNAGMAVQSKLSASMLCTARSETRTGLRSQMWQTAARAEAGDPPMHTTCLRISLSDPNTARVMSACHSRPQSCIPRRAEPIAKQCHMYERKMTITEARAARIAAVLPGHFPRTPMMRPIQCKRPPVALVVRRHHMRASATAKP